MVESTFKCDQCGRLSVGIAWPLSPPMGQDGSSMVVFWDQNPADNWVPAYIHGQSFPNVPGHISDAASEAHKSKSIGNLKSAILMARTVVEATAKAKGISNGSLYSKIDALAAQSIIKEFTKETAHAIRTFGNDMAHGDIELPVEPSDAEMVLEFMDELLNEVFQGPAKLAALQARVAARNQP